MKDEIILTDRLIIGRGTVKDYEKIHEYDFIQLQNIKGICKYVKNDPDDVIKWFKNIKSEYEEAERNKNYFFVVYLKTTKEPIADIGFDRNIPEINAIKISCWLHPNYWGNGYMKEALIGTMQYVFCQGYDNIVYGYLEGNIRSKKLCDSLKFLEYNYSKENKISTNYGMIREYDNIMSKDRFDSLYKKNNIDDRHI